MSAARLVTVVTRRFRLMALPRAAHVFKATSAVKLGNMRYQHYTCWHPDEKRWQTHRRYRELKVCRLKKADPADWRCSLCAFGVPEDELAKSSKPKVKIARDSHRLEKHPGVSSARLNRTKGRTICHEAADFELEPVPGQAGASWRRRQVHSVYLVAFAQAGQAEV